MLAMRIVITPETVVVELRGWNRLWATRWRDLVLPLGQIKLPVRVRPPEAEQGFKGLRVGTNLPGHFTAGSVGCCGVRGAGGLCKGSRWADVEGP